MNIRTFRVTVRVEHDIEADIAINWDEYTAWLDGDEDTPEARIEFLTAGRDLGQDAIDKALQIGRQVPGPQGNASIVAVA